jgi:hypothetical protein
MSPGFSNDEAGATLRSARPAAVGKAASCPAPDSRKNIENEKTVICVDKFVNKKALDGGGIILQMKKLLIWAG